MTRAASLLLLLALTPAAVGQNATRFDVFRGLLRYNGVTEPLTGPPPRPDPCGDVVFVLVGRIEYDRALADATRRCLANGGAVLLAPDGPANLFQYLPSGPLPLLAGNGPLLCGRRENCFRDNGFYPLLSGRTPPVGDAEPDVNLLAVSRLKRIVAAGPSSVDNTDDSPFVPLLVLPSGTVDQRGRPFTNRPVVSVHDPNAANRASGTAVAVANGRMLGNELVSITDADGSLATDNFAFTFFITKHLVGSGDRKRTRCLFIENGRVVTDFDTVQFAAVPPAGTPPVPLPPIEELQEQLVEQGNRLIGDWQDKDGPHRFALGDSAERLPPTLRVLIVAAVVLAGIWLVRRWRAARFQPAQLPRPAAARPEPAYRRAADDRLDSDNLTRPARDHLRAVFAHWGATGGVLPPIQVTGRQRRKIEAALDELWEEAAGRTGRAVTAARWGELRRMINMLRWSADAGEWRFAATGGAA